MSDIFKEQNIETYIFLQFYEIFEKLFKNTPRREALLFVGIISNMSIWKRVKETSNVMHKVTFSEESTGQQNAAIAIKLINKKSK